MGHLTTSPSQDDQLKLNVNAIPKNQNQPELAVT